MLFLVWRPLWYPYVVLIGSTLIFLIWWLSLQPSHDREWDDSVAVLPRCVRQDNKVTIENVRNIDYRSSVEFSVRYETREYDLENLKGVEIIFFYWGYPWMCHPILILDFGPDGRICISIEVRFRKGQRYAILRSLYRQQELIFTIADERDVILRRTKYGILNHGYLYRLNENLDRVRRVFIDYINAVNDLYVKPRWYHGLATNWTTSFYRLPSSIKRYDWRIFVNGRLDSLLYEKGLLDRSVPFEELRRTAYINDIANSAPYEEFSDHLHTELKRKRNEQ